jgi:exopolysaccharide biosynthesis polyprenyl glycosylphosphotransferase
MLLVGAELRRRLSPAVRSSAPLRRSWPYRLRRNPLHTVLTIALDVASATLSVGLARLWGADDAEQMAGGWMVWLFVPLVLGALAATSMYRRNLQRNFLDEIVPVATAIAVSALVLLSCLVADPDQVRPGSVVVPIWLCATVLMLAVRLGRAWEQRWLRNHFYFESASRTLVLGDDAYVRHLIAHMFAIREYGLLPVGILGLGGSRDDDQESLGGFPTVPHVGTLEDFADVAVAMEVEDLVVSACGGTNEQLIAAIRSAHGLGIRVWVLPRVHDAIGVHARLEHLGGLPLLVIPPLNPRSWLFGVKHAMDRVLSAIGLLLIAPIFLGLALLVWLSSPGPIFFRQERVGRDAKIFDCLKFRSMRPRTESDAPFELSAGTAPGGIEGLDRRTLVGKIMRATSLDELPQLINVLRGDMSLVGPRPERPEFVEVFEGQIERYGERHRVKAGLTGWAQVHGLRGQTSIADRAEWDNYYIENWTLALDVKILLLTVLAVLKRTE